MEKSDLKDNLSWLFIQVSFRAKAGLVKIAEEHELSFPQLYTLSSMEPGKPLQMNEIANLLSCDPSNVTGIIDRLFSHRYIERKENPRDRRAKMITLTAKGIKLREEILIRIMHYKPKVFANLDGAQRKQLTTLLKQALE